MQKEEKFELIFLHSTEKPLLHGWEGVGSYEKGVGTTFLHLCGMDFSVVWNHRIYKQAPGLEQQAADNSLRKNELT